MIFDLAFVWAFLIAFAIYAYVVLDGFDLGAGILFLAVRDEGDRDRMVSSIAPVWDGNETWLVLGGGGLMAAFPLAYAVLMTALYPLIIAMLLGLIFRGVAFEFRFRSPAAKPMWDFCFAAGSTLAALCQGIALGAFVQGVAVAGRSYGGGWFDWLTPFSVMTGVALVAGYALLGATWLILKTDGALQERMFALARPLTLIVAGFIGLVSLWTPLTQPEIASRWFSWPNIILLSPVPLIVLAGTLALIAALGRRAEWIAYPLALGLFTLSFVGLGISMFPYVVPRAITIWQAAAPDESLSFLLAGAAVLIPIILAYTAHAYWVFRGKVDSDTSYH